MAVNQWGGGNFDKLIFCGNLKQFPSLVSELVDISPYIPEIEKLESHGTTAVFCEIEPNPYSWMYMPSTRHQSHRIICTGNFSPTNNKEGTVTGTVEFTDFISENDIKDNLSRIPYVRKYLTHHYEQYTYPIQQGDTRKMICSLKEKLAEEGIFLLGRFAEWEYYNMDAAIGAAMDLFNSKALWQ